MAEDKPKSEANEVSEENALDEAPTISLPTRTPLPPPPEISFTRPNLGSAAPRELNSLHDSHPDMTRENTAVSNKSQSPFNLGSGLSAGITLASSVVVGFLIGQWIDHHWHLTGLPWGTIIFSLAGVSAGFINLFRILSASDASNRKTTDRKK